MRDRDVGFSRESCDLTYYDTISESPIGKLEHGYRQLLSDAVKLALERNKDCNNIKKWLQENPLDEKTQQDIIKLPKTDMASLAHKRKLEKPEKEEEEKEDVKDGTPVHRENQKWTKIKRHVTMKGTPRWVDGFLNTTTGEFVIASTRFRAQMESGEPTEKTEKHKNNETTKEQKRRDHLS